MLDQMNISDDKKAMLKAFGEFNGKESVIQFQ
jgi:hypothetical protein